MLPRVTLGPNPTANPVDGARVGIVGLIGFYPKRAAGDIAFVAGAVSKLFSGRSTATASRKPFRSDFGATS